MLVRRLASRTSGRSTRPSSDARAPDDTLEGALLPRPSGELATSRRDEIERRFPEGAPPRRRLQPRRRSSDPTEPFNLAKLIVGSEGTLGRRRRGEDQPGAAAGGQGGADDRVRRSARCAGGDARRSSRHRPSAVEVMDRFILDHTQQSPALRRAAAQHSCEGDPGALLCVEFYGDRAEDLPPRLEALEARSARARPSLPLATRDRRAGRSGAHLELPRGGARPVDGDEGRRQVAVVRRGHRGRAREAARLHRAVPADRARRTARSPASTRTRRSAACTCGRS